MRNRLKRCKALIYVLIVAMILPIGISSHKVYAAVADSEDEITPSVIVYNYKDLIRAIDNAEDGEVIGIASNIEVDSGIQMLGCDDKKITIIKAFEGAFIRMYLNVDVKVKNIVFDGNSSVYNWDYNPMIQVEGKAEFENVTFQNCYNQWGGGAIKTEGGRISLIGCHFVNNEASEGGHIMVGSSTYVEAIDSIFENGKVSRAGGAVKIEYNYDTENDNEIVFVGCKVIGNQAGYGGAIANKGNVKIIDSIIYGNTAEIGADILNYCGSSFEMDSIAELIELYATDGILPLEWEFDYIDKAYIEGDIDKGNPLSAMKLKFDKVKQEDDSNLDNLDKPSDGEDIEDKPQSGNNNNENNSLIDSDNMDNSEDKEDAPSDASGDSDTENEDSQNKDTTEDGSNTSNNPFDNELPGSTENSSEQNNTDSTENEGGKAENNSTDSNVTTGGNGNQDVDSSVDESTENNSSDTPSTEETTETNAPNNNENDIGNNQSGTVDNGNNSNLNNATSNSGDNGTQNNDSPGDDSNIVLDNHKPADNDSSNSTNTNNGTSQNGGNAISKPENNDNNSADSGNKDTVSGSGSVPNITSPISGDNVSNGKDESIVNNGNENKPSNNTEQKNTIAKKKVIKKLSLTAKKGKKKITGKTIKKAIVKVKIGKKTYKIKSNAKGKFMVKLKGKAKLKKGQKIVVAVKKNGYKTKKKVFKVK